MDAGNYVAEEFDLGWWPECLGCAFVAGMLAFLIGYADGIM